MRLKHYAYRTEETYIQWIRRYILFHGKRHPKNMSRPEIEAFLTDLAVNQQVAASTQHQALNAVLFLYRKVLGIEIAGINAVRANQPRNLPVVLTKQEALAMLWCVTAAPNAPKHNLTITHGSMPHSPLRKRRSLKREPSQG
jgi:integrase